MSAIYCIFDGDNDRYAYSFLKGWRSLENVDFDFEDAHELDNMTSRAQGEAYVKRKLRERMSGSSIVIVLIGDKTKNLFKFVRWEIELAIELGLPIIAVNLNSKRSMDSELCPPILKNHCAVHICYKKDIIKFAIEKWPNGYRNLSLEERSKGPRYYADEIYKKLGL